MALDLSEAIVDFYSQRTKRNHFWTKGFEGQEKIRKLKIGVAGLGGMGSNIAEIFARLGVGTLRIADPDTIDISNINRQVIANINTVGQKKLDASVNELMNIDPSIVLQKYPEGITETNADEFVEGVDVVINEIDVLHIKEQVYLLNAARKKGIPVYTTLVVGLGIRLYKFSPTSTFTPENFFGALATSPSVDGLIEVFGNPLPSYLSGDNLEQFKGEVSSGIPIFGASTYLGQSLLAIRVLTDLGFIRESKSVPKTPELPEFLTLDPLTLEMRIDKF